MYTDVPKFFTWNKQKVGNHWSKAFQSQDSPTYLLQILWADYVQFSLSNGNAFFCICYWLTFLDLHPSNICKKSMALYMIHFMRVISYIYWRTIIIGTSHELISTSNLSIIFNNIYVFSVWSICSVLFSWPIICSVFQGWKSIKLFVYIREGLTKNIVHPMVLR